MTQPSAQEQDRTEVVKVAPQDVIVTSEHEGRIRAVLSFLNIGTTAVEASDLLGLTKLTIERIEDAAELVVRLVTNSPGAADWRSQNPPPPSSATGLDRFLWGLRGVFAASNDGWSPTMGKNRYVGQVHGVGQVNHGGGDDPKIAGQVNHGTPPKTKFVADQIKASGGDDPQHPGPMTWYNRTDGPGQGVRVGVLDTAIYAHPWLAGGWVAPFDDTVRDGEPHPFADGHATFVTGLILRQAPSAIVEVHQVLNEHGAAESWAVAKAIVELGGTGLDILNLSFTCYTEDGQPPLVLATAIDRLDPAVVVVAAAGNHGDAANDSDAATDGGSRTPAWPAALDDVIAVGAFDAQTGRRASFSPDAPWVDVLAPGVKLLSTYLPEAEDAEGKCETFDDGFALWDGTSFSAALVSGAIAAEMRPVTVRQAEPASYTARQAGRRVVHPLYPTASASRSSRSTGSDERGIHSLEQLEFPSTPYLHINPLTAWSGTP